MRTYDLSCQYDSRASFYGKARVSVEPNGDLILTSYNTDVALITANKAIVRGLYSNTTTRHIKEFLLQNGYKAVNSKQIMADYGKAEA